jgi:predicted phosphodiesterase
MNVLALYDIHGNVDALEAVLADERGSDADVVLVGGDAVPGPFARDTLARLEALPIPVRWIRGNGEREVAEAVGGPEPADDDLAARTAAMTAAEIGDDAARALGEVPLTLELDGVLYCHATPRRDDEMLTRISPPERWAEALDDVDHELVVAGHTHSACRTRATAPLAGCGWPTACPSYARPPTTAPGRAAASWRPDGRTNARSGPRSSSPSTRSS